MTDALGGPPAGGIRVPFSALPPRVRGWVERVLGDRVDSATTQAGGFSPGVAARLVTRSGRRAFVKAVSSEANPQSPQMHRREARITAALPPGLPIPRLLDSYDDGTWVALLLDDVDGRHPHLPWRREELQHVLAALEQLSGALTPSPLPDIEDAVDLHAELFDNWAALAADPLPGVDPWAADRLAQLAALEARAVAAAAGDTLLHVDTRADNLLLTADRVWLVDWPSAARGHPLLDLVAFAPSVAMQGGPAPDELLQLSGTGRQADADRLVPLVVAVGGYFVRHALLPPPPGIPTVRPFQAAQGAVMLHWLRQLTGWH